MIFIYIVGGIFALLVVFISGAYVYSMLRYPFLREKEEGFKFVYIEDDSTVRELFDDEKGFFTKKYQLADPNRPYIKNSYKQQSPDGKISGYIIRRRIPRDIAIIKRNSDLKKSAIISRYVAK